MVKSRKTAKCGVFCYVFIGLPAFSFGLHPALSLDQDQRLKRMPLGFDPDTAYADYIKLKNFCLSGSFDDSRLDLDEIAEIFRSAKPFLDYINRAIEFAKEEM